MMKISVITVAYNAASTISDTLRSVSEQDYGHIEHILVDGASTDNTFDMMKTHAVAGARMISEPDQGLYDAINKGIRLATGDIIAILNADDVYAYPQVLSRVAALMSQDPCDALLGDVSFFKPEAPEQSVRRYRSDRFTPSRIKWGWMPAHPAMFLHKRVYERFGLYKTDYKIAADFEYTARIFKSESLIYRYCPEVMVRMRLGGVSTRSLRNTILLNQEVIRACRDNNIKTNLFMILSKYIFKLKELI